MSNRQEIINRLRKVEGQIRGLQRMLSEGKSCEPILVQLIAARAALDKAALAVIEDYMQQCLNVEPGLQAEITRIIDLILRMNPQE